MKIELRDIWFYYEKKVWVLKGVSAIFEEGINCIFGLNGSGKTTLIRLIMGSLKPKKGKIFLDGRPIKSMKQASKFMVYVPTNPQNFFIEPTVKDEFSREGLKIIEPLKPLKDKKVIELSEGQKRIVALTLALLSKKRVVLLDEPTVGLDKQRMKMFFDMMKAVASKKIIIVATNEPKMLFSCDKIFIFRDGKLYLTENPIEAIRAMPYETHLKRLIDELESRGAKIESIDDLKQAVAKIC